MVFSSTLFLFLFLPITLGIYYILDKRWKNIFLLLCSLCFYAWGEKYLVLLLIAAIGANFSIGIIISHFLKQGRINFSKIALTVGIAANISILFFYKYLGFLTNIFGLSNTEGTTQIAIPLGISFFTFQNISYLIDVFRKAVPVQKNIIHLAVYISMFPQLVAGPIVRYSDIFSRLKKRIINREMLEQGIVRFIRGLAKKVIIANHLGLIVDKTFALEASEMSSMVAWIATLCYTLQIYFDFSGYSDMAMGIGKMLGFDFKENFNYPYIARSVRDFWRRWHISLSTWFRDYLYIPLGGNRNGRWFTLINLLIVFFITGLWHGANWTFIAWGMFHGFFLIVERLFPIKLPKHLDGLKHLYLLLIVSLGWVVFRADTLEYALTMLGNMVTFSGGTDNSPLLYVNSQTIILIGTGILFSFPTRKFIAKIFHKRVDISLIYITTKYSFYILLFIFSSLELAQTTYNPFIYFRF